MALFRLLDLAGGRILLDGVDIGGLPLKEVGTVGAASWGSQVDVL
jgi:ABC-type multidrug transport system fused ATPase/permease subunit